MAATSVRMSAEERREAVIRAAMTEFGRSGFFGTSTEAIARRVGVSQPYLFRLFPNKRALFRATVIRCMEDTWRVLEAGAEGLEGEEALHAMGDAYLAMVGERRDYLLLQMQMYVSTAAAIEAGDAEVGEIVRRLWRELWQNIAARTGLPPEKIAQFFACGMLINVMTAMGFPEGDPLWECLVWQS